jgi:hypothetical protein
MKKITVWDYQYIQIRTVTSFIRQSLDYQYIQIRTVTSFIRQSLELREGDSLQS